MLVRRRANEESIGRIAADFNLPHTRWCWKLFHHWMGNALPIIIQFYLRREWSILLGFGLQIADAIRPTITGYSADYQEFRALQYSLFTVVFVNVLGAFMFIVAGWYLVGDRAKVDQAVASNVTDEPAS